MHGLQVEDDDQEGEKNNKKERNNNLLSTNLQICDPPTAYQLIWGRSNNFPMWPAILLEASKWQNRWPDLEKSCYKSDYIAFWLGTLEVSFVKVQQNDVVDFSWNFHDLYLPNLKQKSYVDAVQQALKIMTKCDNSKTNFDELLNWILNNKEKFETTKAFARKQEVKNLCKLKSKKRHHVDSIDSVIETVQKQRSTSEIASTEIDEQLKVCLEAIRVEEIIEKPPNFKTSQTNKSSSGKKRIDVCEFCGVTFSYNSGGLLNHLNYEHFGWRWRCELCKQEKVKKPLYNNRHSVVAHLKRRHAEQIKGENLEKYWCCIRFEKYANQNWSMYLRRNRKQRRKFIEIDELLSSPATETNISSLLASYSQQLEVVKEQKEKEKQKAETPSLMFCRCCEVGCKTLVELEEHLCHSFKCNDCLRVHIGERIKEEPPEEFNEEEDISYEVEVKIEDYCNGLEPLSLFPVPELLSMDFEPLLVPQQKQLDSALDKLSVNLKATQTSETLSRPVSPMCQQKLDPSLENVSTSFEPTVTSDVFLHQATPTKSLLSLQSEFLSSPDNVQSSLSQMFVPENDTSFVSSDILDKIIFTDIADKTASVDILDQISVNNLLSDSALSPDLAQSSQLRVHSLILNEGGENLIVEENQQHLHAQEETAAVNVVQCQNVSKFPNVKRSGARNLIKCTWCPVTLKSIADFKDHLTTIHLAQGAYKCKHCKFSANDEQSLATHSQCHFCRSNCDQNNFKRNLIKNAIIYVCLFCDRKFDNFDSLSNHEILHKVC